MLQLRHGPDCLWPFLLFLLITQGCWKQSCLKANWNTEVLPLNLLDFPQTQSGCSVKSVQSFALIFYSSLQGHRTAILSFLPYLILALRPNEKYIWKICGWYHISQEGGLTFPVEMQEGKKWGMNTKLCMSKDSGDSKQLLEQGPPETDLSSDWRTRDIPE